MAKVEVLCATMHQTDFSKLQEMNIQTDAVFANQADRFDYQECTHNDRMIKMVTTADRGVGKNRNLALMYASEDILLLADDDMIYADDYEQGILNAFEELPQADVIIFSCDVHQNGKLQRKIVNPIQKRNFFNALQFGTYIFAVRKKSIIKANVSFTQLFGGGTLYSAGEDSLFLMDCFRKGLKVYTHAFNLGICVRDSSTWFTGYNEKYFYDKGAWLACVFPHLAYIIRFYFLFRFKKLTELSYRKINQLLKAGINGFATLRTYEQYTKI